MSAEVPATLRFLGRLRAKFEEFRKTALRQLDRKNAVARVECSDYMRGPLCSAFLEIDIDESRAVVWWIDIGQDDDGSWVIDRYVMWNGRDPITSLDTITVPTLLENESVVMRAVDDLAETVSVVSSALGGGA